jgi:hypothetical protein
VLPQELDVATSKDLKLSQALAPTLTKSIELNDFAFLSA